MLVIFTDYRTGTPLALPAAQIDEVRQFAGSTRIAIHYHSGVALYDVQETVDDVVALVNRARANPAATPSSAGQVTTRLNVSGGSQ